MAITAFIDESWTPNGPYILGGPLVPNTSLSDVRYQMLALRRDAGRKLHFHDEPGRRRRLIIDSIAGLGLDLIVAISDVDPACKPERRRRGALRGLVSQMAAAGVETVVFESRGKADNNRDLQMLQNLRSSRELTVPLRATFKAGPSEPCLWVADFLCGSITQHHAGNPELKERLDAYIRSQQIPADFEIQPHNPQIDSRVA